MTPARQDNLILLALFALMLGIVFHFGLLNQKTDNNVSQLAGSTNSNENAQKTSPLAINQLHIAPDYLYPNPQMTPGKADTLNLSDLLKSYNDQTYSQAHRNVSQHEKTAVMNEYPLCKGQKEIDHFIPLSIGGSNDIKNLWCQPATNKWGNYNYGYVEKDKLETYLAAEVKANDMTPENAQNCITQDWISCYRKYGLDKVLGATNKIWDKDDEIMQ